jgi:hypothetical protein
MEKKTAVALESPDPFGTPIPEPKRIDGLPVVAERKTPAKQAETAPLNNENASYEAKSDVPHGSTPDLEPPVKDRRDSEDATPETIPDDVAEFLRDQEEPMLLNNLPEISVQESCATEKFENPIIASRSTEGLPSYRCEFSGRDIFMGWPWYKTTNPVTAACAFAIGQDFGRDKLRMDMSIGDSKIEHARNRLAHKFLETDAKWLWMIDDDIIPSIGRPAWMRHWVHAARHVGDAPLQRHVLHRLIGSGKTLVAGAYFGRQEGGAIMCSDLSLAPRAKVYEESVVPVDWVATGCMLIHRKVFQDIKEKYGDSLKIKNPEYDYDYFRPFDSVGGEDVAFCKRAKTAGHQPYIDLAIPIYHVGYKTY